MPLQRSGLDYVGVKIWSQMGFANFQIGLCTAVKDNRVPLNLCCFFAGIVMSDWHSKRVSSCNGAKCK